MSELLKQIMKNPALAFLSLGHRELLNWVPDETYLKIAYRIRTGKKLNIESPITFNEKLQWLKLHDRKSIYTTMVDKYEVKKYVANIIGEEYIIPTLGVWNHFDEIDFNSLPNQFVLKCTHDSGGLVIVKDKTQLDYKKTKKVIEKSMKHNYYWGGREWPYKNVKPRIMAEQYMEEKDTGELRDYKFFCFGGIAKCYKVDFDRFIQHRANYFNIKGEYLEFGEKICPPDKHRCIEIPSELEIMKKLAEVLSSSRPFLRVDFYNIDGKVYFGELTFFPASGFGKFIYDDNDELFGKWLKIPGGGIA